MTRHPSIPGRKQRKGPRDYAVHDAGRNEPHPPGTTRPFRRLLIGIFSCVHDISLYLSIVTTPPSPSTVMRCPLWMRSVATPVPSTAGM